MIAFGGRALDPDASAKYLNSPETPLFHKGANLYNFAQRPHPALDKAQVIAVEGYMDAIALAEAGFPHTVAPLGTALTEDQIRLLWRMAPEPVLCFDGDAAGRRAAFRAVETVLPHLKPGFSVQFAFLPDGLDPDDLVRQHGPAAFQAVLDSKRCRCSTCSCSARRSAAGASTPEQRASLEARLQALVARIADRGVRATTSASCARPCGPRTARSCAKSPAGGRRAATVCGQATRQYQLDWRVAARATERTRLGALPRAATLGLAPVRSNELAERSLPLPARETLLIATLLNHPWLLEARCEEVAELTLTSPPLARLRDALLELLARNVALDRGEIRTQLTDWAWTRSWPWSSGRSPTEATVLLNRKRKRRRLRRLAISSPSTRRRLV